MAGASGYGRRGRREDVDEGARGRRELPAFEWVHAGQVSQSRSDFFSAAVAARSIEARCRGLLRGLLGVQPAEGERRRRRAGEGQLVQPVLQHDAVVVVAEHILQTLHGGGEGLGLLAEGRADRFGGVPRPLGRLARTVQLRVPGRTGRGAVRRGEGLLDVDVRSGDQPPELLAGRPTRPLGERRVAHEPLESADQEPVALRVQGRDDGVEGGPLALPGLPVDRASDRTIGQVMG